MSKTLVLHIGPGKCGSSTIQNFFHSNKRACIEKYSFWEVPPHLIDDLASQESSDELEKQLFKPLKKLLKKRGHTLLSHEYFFQRPKAIRAICQFATSFVDKTIIIGYARNQPEWIISAFSQWIFRSKIRLEENTSILAAHGLNPIHFTQLEKHLIAGVITDFKSARQLTNQEIFYWNKGYQTIQDLTNEFQVEIKVGLVPTKSHSHNLIEDFCRKALLSIKEKYKPQTTLRSNTSFSPHITEAISVATEQGVLEIDAHSQNEILHKLSHNTKNKESDSEKKVLDVFKAYSSNFFFEHNKMLCNLHELDPTYFNNYQTVSKEETIKHFATQAQFREKDHLMLTRTKQSNSFLIQLLINNLNHLP